MDKGNANRYDNPMPHICQPVQFGDHEYVEMGEGNIGQAKAEEDAVVDH